MPPVDLIVSEFGHCLSERKFYEVDTRSAFFWIFAVGTAELDGEIRTREHRSNRATRLYRKYLIFIFPALMRRQSRIVRIDISIRTHNRTIGTLGGF